MSTDDLDVLRRRSDVPAWRLRLAERIESARAQRTVIAVIILNAAVMGLQTDAGAVAAAGHLLSLVDRLCLAVFVVELALKLVAYGRSFWRSGWRVFDLVVVGIALVPSAGPWAVLRALRVLRVLRLLTMVPSLRRVVAAFLHAIPGLLGVMAVMAIFFYTAAVLATQLFGESFPQWFGGIGPSLYSLFQIMTLESWSMGIVRPVMEVYPGAWAFFVPFIIIATFTILNLFIGIIVSTMQELALEPEQGAPAPDAHAILTRMEADLAALRAEIARSGQAVADSPGTTTPRPSGEPEDRGAGTPVDVRP